MAGATGVLDTALSRRDDLIDAAATRQGAIHCYTSAMPKHFGERERPRWYIGLVKSGDVGVAIRVLCRTWRIMKSIAFM